MQAHAHTCVHTHTHACGVMLRLVLIGGLPASCCVLPLRPAAHCHACRCTCTCTCAPSVSWRTARSLHWCHALRLQCDVSALLPLTSEPSTRPASVCFTTGVATPPVWLGLRSVPVHILLLTPPPGPWRRSPGCLQMRKCGRRYCWRGGWPAWGVCPVPARLPAMVRCLGRVHLCPHACWPWCAALSLIQGAWHQGLRPPSLQLSRSPRLEKRLHGTIAAAAKAHL